MTKNKLLSMQEHKQLEQQYINVDTEELVTSGDIVAHNNQPTFFLQNDTKVSSKSVRPKNVSI